MRVHWDNKCVFLFHRYLSCVWSHLEFKLCANRDMYLFCLLEKCCGDNNDWTSTKKTVSVVLPAVRMSDNQSKLLPYWENTDEKIQTYLQKCESYFRVELDKQYDLVGWHPGLETNQDRYTFFIICCVYGTFSNQIEKYHHKTILMYIIILLRLISMFKNCELKCPCAGFHNYFIRFKLIQTVSDKLCMYTYIKQMYNHPVNALRGLLKINFLCSPYNRSKIVFFFH